MKELKGKPGRPRKPNTETGGKDRFPRSLGLTFEACELEKGLKTKQQVQSKLFGFECRYWEKKSRSKTGRTIPDWKACKHNLDFATTWRYGVISETWSGVIHLTSLIYSEIRDANYVKPENKAEHILELKKIAAGLRSMANKIDEFIQRTQSGNDKIIEGGRSEEDNNAWWGNHAYRQYHCKHLISPILESYREGAESVTSSNNN